MQNKIGSAENILLSGLYALNNSIKTLVDSKENKLQLVVKDLNAQNPLEILAKGYSKLELDGKRVSSVSQVQVDDKISCNLLDGKLTVVVKEKKLI